MAAGCAYSAVLRGINAAHKIWMKHGYNSGFVPLDYILSYYHLSRVFTIIFSY